MPEGGRTTLFEDPHCADRDGRQHGPGGRDEQPTEKAKPDVEVRDHAVKVHKRGRPAHEVGDKAAPEPKDPDAR